MCKAAREKDYITYKGMPTRILADFSIEILNTIRAWTVFLQVLKDQRYQPRVLHPEKKYKL